MIPLSKEEAVVRHSLNQKRSTRDSGSNAPQQATCGHAQTPIPSRLGDSGPQSPLL